MRHLPLRTLSTLVLALLALAAYATDRYTVVDLDPHRTGFHGVDLNDRGPVVGVAFNPDGRQGVFLYSGGTQHNLGLDTVSSTASAINDAGQIVGDMGFPLSQAFLYSEGNAKNLGALVGAFDSIAAGMNNAGDVVGTWRRSLQEAFHTRTFLYSGGAVHDLGALGGDDSRASDINESGQITGSLYRGSTEHPFLYTNGVVQDLGSLNPAYDVARPTRLNDLGQIVGYYYVDPNRTQAFLYSDGTLRSIGTLSSDHNRSFAANINNAGRVVGTSLNEQQFSARAFFYDGSVMIDLNGLLVNGAGWTITEAVAINERGQIVAQARYEDGLSHAVLLNPVPEPTSMMALGLGILSLTRRRKRA